MFPHVPNREINDKIFFSSEKQIEGFNIQLKREREEEKKKEEEEVQREREGERERESERERKREFRGGRVVEMG